MLYSWTMWHNASCLLLQAELPPLCCAAARLLAVHQWIGISPDDLTAGGKTTLQTLSQIADDLRVNSPSLSRWAALKACPVLHC